MDKDKKMKAGLAVAVCSAVLGAAAAVSYSVLSRDGEGAPGIVYLLTIAGVVLQAVVSVFSGRKTKYNSSSALSSVLFMGGFIAMMMARIEWLGGLAAHNASLTPLHMSFFVTIVLFVLAVVLSVVSAFMPMYGRKAD